MDHFRRRCCLAAHCSVAGPRSTFMTSHSEADYVSHHDHSRRLVRWLSRHPAAFVSSTPQSCTGHAHRRVLSEGGKLWESMCPVLLLLVTVIRPILRCTWEGGVRRAFGPSRAFAKPSGRAAQATSQVDGSTILLHDHVGEHARSLCKWIRTPGTRYIRPSVPTGRPHPDGSTAPLEPRPRRHAGQGRARSVVFRGVGPFASAR